MNDDQPMHDDPYGRDPMVLRMETDARELRYGLAHTLARGGQITDPAWRQAFEQVPRHDLVPSFWHPDETGRLRRMERGEPGWLECIYSDQVLITQVITGIATSSSTGPGLMAVMLEALSVHGREKVLEIATGTGYNAAVLSERLGSDRVTTVEVDPDLAKLADRRLHRAGYAPTVVAGDGRHGHPDGAPYDRLITTCGMETIPYAWVEQVRPGGIIVSPHGGGIVRLTVAEDGTATGRFLPQPSYFMAARDAGQTGMATHPGRTAETRPGAARVTALEWATSGMLRFLGSLVAPGISWATETDPAAGEVHAVELWAADGSWARVDGADVEQAGPRNLWSAIEAACEAWETAGAPGREAFGLTVAKDGSTLWLEDEAQPFPATAGATP